MISKYQKYYFDDLGSTLIKYFQKSKDIAKIYLIYLKACPSIWITLYHFCHKKKHQGRGDRLHKKRLKKFFGLSQNRRGQGSWNELLLPGLVYLPEKWAKIPPKVQFKVDRQWSFYCTYWILKFLMKTMSSLFSTKSFVGKPYFVLFLLHMLLFNENSISKCTY